MNQMWTRGKAGQPDRMLLYDPGEGRLLLWPGVWKGSHKKGLEGGPCRMRLRAKEGEAGRLAAGL